MMSSRQNAVIHSKVAKAPTKKTMNKIMPITARDGVIVPGEDEVNPMFLNNSLSGVAPQPNPNPPEQKFQPTPKDKLYSYLGQAQPSVASDDYNQFDPKWRSDNFMNPDPMPTTYEPGMAKEKAQPKDRNIALKLASNDMIAGAVAMAAGAIPDQIKQDNQNRTPTMYNPRPYGDGTQAIAKYGKTLEGGGSIPKIGKSTSIQQWNAAHPDQQVNRPIEDYQKEFTTTPFGRSKVDNYGSQAGTGTGQPLNPADKTNWNSYQTWMAQSNPLYGTDALNHGNESGQLTSASSFGNYEYIHNDAQGNQIGYQAPSVTPMSQGQMENWWQGNRNKATQSSISAPVQQQIIPQAPKAVSPNDVGMPTREQALEKYKSRKGAQLPSKYFEGGKRNKQADYSVDSVRKANRMGENGLELDEDEMTGDIYAKHGMMMLGEGGIKTYGKNAHSDSMQVSEGPSHTDGGMPMLIHGKKVEIQGGEGIQQYPDDATVVFGGMRIPNLGPETKGIRGRTFQSIAKDIAKEEEKNTKKMGIPSQEVEGLDPSNRFDSLTLGSKEAMKIGFNMRSAALTAQKNSLREIQDLMHKNADDQGIDHDKAHTMYGKDGLTINAKKGVVVKKPKVTAPKFTPIGEPDPNTEMPHPAYKPRAAKNPFNELDPQGAAYNKSVDTGVVPQLMPEQNNQWRAGMTDEEAQSNINTRHKLELPPNNRMRSLADENNLKATDFLSELSYLGKTPDQVLSQEYKPYLNTPYQVSFQDRRNANQSTFNELTKQLQASGSAASLAALAGQKYEADNQVNAEEFRANQGIYNAINNQNYNTLNDASKTNMQLKDQQYVRQSQAKSNTDSHRAQALASISSKIAANRYENMNIRLTEERSGYRWNPTTKRMEWEGGDYQFQPYGSGQGTASAQSRVTKKYGPDNEYLGKEEIDYPDAVDNLNQSRANRAQRRAFSKFGNSFKS